MEYASLIAEFGARYGIGELKPDENGVVGISADGRSVTFMQQSGGDLVIALAELCEAPEMGADRVNRLLMQANQPMFMEDGFVIVHHEGSGRYCLMARFDVASMDFLDFDRTVGRLLQRAEHWNTFLEKFIPIAAEAATADDSPEEPVAPGDMMLV